MIAVKSWPQNFYTFSQKKAKAFHEWLKRGYWHFMKDMAIFHMLMLTILYTIALGFIIAPTINSTDPNMQSYQQYQLIIWLIWIIFTIYFAGYKRGLTRYAPAETKVYLTKKYWKDYQKKINNISDEKLAKKVLDDVLKNLKQEDDKE